MEVRLHMFDSNTSPAEIAAVFGGAPHPEYPEQLEQFKAHWSEMSMVAEVEPIKAEIEKLIGHCETVQQQPMRSISELNAILRDPRTSKMEVFQAIADNLSTAHDYENHVLNLNDIYVVFSNRLRE